MKTDHFKLKPFKNSKCFKLRPSYIATTQRFSPYFIPAQLIKAYKFPTGTGAGQKLAFISLGGGYLLQDVKDYLKLLEIDSSHIIVTDVLIDGATNTPGADESADTENIMDLEIIISVCPEASIFAYIAPNSEEGFYNAVHQAGIIDQVDVISISWGNNENNWTTFGLSRFNLLLKEIAEIGITTVFCAAGDWGSSSQGEGLNVIFPASSPFSVTCGGTTLVTNDNDEITSETVWNRNPETAATGGGLSVQFQTPSYQLENVHNIDLQGQRGVPDVASVSDSETGIVVYSAAQGGLFVVGGTSASAPLWTGLIGRMNQNLKAQGLGNVGFMNPVIYTATETAFNDITIGNNGFYQSVKLYDLCTGNGTPNGIKLLNLYSNTLLSSFEYSVFNYNSFSFVDKSLGEPVSWEWNFGDDSKTLTEQNPTHTFANKTKSYTITLTVINAAGQVSLSSQTVNVIAGLQTIPIELIISLSVVFGTFLLCFIVFLAYKFSYLASSSSEEQI